MNKLFWMIIFSVFFMTGCATTSTFQPQNPRASQHWRAQGKILMQYEGKAETASLDWQQNEKQYDVRIFGPLGIGAVEFKGDDSTDVVVSEKILGGHPLPVSNLASWLKGVKTSQYQGWSVHYLSYHQNNMPKLMTASNKTIYLRIFIDKWQFF